MEERKISMEEGQRLAADMLRQMHEFCVANGLHYYVSGGTMLGAVRHKGFIPWDDDIDVVMPRADFEKFMDTFVGENCIASCNRKYKDEFYTFGHLIDTRTRLVGVPADHFGIFIDIFVADSIPDWKFIRPLYIKLGHAVNRLVRLSLEPKEIVPARFRKVQVIARLLGFKVCSLIWDTFFGKNCPQNTKDVIIFSSIFGNRAIEKRQDTVDLMVAPFEDFECLIPKAYDDMLTRRYGDYMTPPPEDQRRPRHTGDKKYFAWR